MRLDLFDYGLPEGLIAQAPSPRRGEDRLLDLSRGTGEVRHFSFGDLPRLLRPGDLLVLNDTRVFPARLLAAKPTGGKVELFLLEHPGECRGRVPCLPGSARRAKDGSVLTLEDGTKVAFFRRDGTVWIEGKEGDLAGAVDRVGHTPLPPYIRRREGEDPRDRERYQTVFARRRGAVAAPTAGLHFSESLLEAVGKEGVRIAFLTLHVGPGTFLPVRTEEAEGHLMHPERYEIPGDTARAVEETKRSGGRVVAVGTTVVRALESAAVLRGMGGEETRVGAGAGETTLFILPGFRFRAVDALLTNFHLPRSTLLMLVSAFAGREMVLEAYRQAIEKGYRFYSYGDAMFIH